MFKSLSSEKKFQIYLTLLALAGLVFILLATAKYGAGVSSDAGRNLSTADSLLKGKGFVDFASAPFVLWPPLYPLVIAGLSLLTKWSVFQSAWYLNVVLYAVNIWLCGWLLYLIFKEKQIYAWVGALMILLSRSTLRIYANVASEPLFVTFMLIFFFAAAQYLQSKSLRALWLMFIMAGLGTFQRYLGVVLFGVGGLVVLYKENWRGVRRSILPVIISVLPIGAWALLHNIPVSGAPFGPRAYGDMFPLENISLSLTKILWWFIPRLSFLDPLLLNPWIILVSVVVLLFVINKKSNWLEWFRSLKNIYLWPALLFSIVYFFLLAFTVITADHLDLTSDRYYVIILPIVVAFLFVTFDKLVFSHINFNNHMARYAVIAFVGLWFIYPIYAVQGYLSLALVQGEPSNYNIANSAQYREMGVVKAAENIIGKDSSAALYTNYLNIVWFIYQRPVTMLPFEDTNQSRDERLAGLQKYYPGWPGAKSGYIIWFTPNQYHFYASPDDLSAIADLKLLYQDKTGEIYYVQTKAP